MQRDGAQKDVNMGSLRCAAKMAAVLGESVYPPPDCRKGVNMSNLRRTIENRKHASM